MAGHSYLLDTNILSDLIKHPSGTVARRIAAVGETAVCTSIVVACELRYGAAKKGSAALSGKVGQLLEEGYPLSSSDPYILWFWPAISFS